MKRKLVNVVLGVMFAFMLTSCYSHTFVIGDGPKTGVVVTAKNNFFLYGLIPGKVSDPQKMAGGAKDYQVTEVHTFLDGLIGSLTFGIYTPTTTKVQK